MAATHSSLTTWQYLKLKLVLIAIPSMIIPRALLLYMFNKTSGVRCPTATDIIRNRIIQWLSATLDHQQLRVATEAPEINSGTIEIYRSRLSSGSTISAFQTSQFKSYWVPCHPKGEYNILYIHGGGFASGSTAGCVEYLVTLAAELHSRMVSCSIMSVDYDLSPEARFPTALSQVAAAYEYITSLGKPVLLMGDSAGGNICLSLLRHIQDPHPAVKPLDTAQLPILMVLVSPWVDLKNGGDSVKRHETYDCVDKSTLDRWSQQYTTIEPFLDPHLDHLNMKIAWDDILPKHTLIVAGEMECFISEITEIAGNMERSDYGGLHLHIEPSKCHAWPAVDFAFGGGGSVGGGRAENTTTQLASKGLRYQADWISRKLRIV